MANTTVHVTTIALNTATANPAGTAIVAADTHVITPTKATSKVLLRITNTTASTKIATILAGDNPPADAAGQGSLAVSLTDGSTTPQTAYVVVEGSRFLQNDGSIQITVASGMTGNIEAIQLP
jgi:hypothetical protein